jgi:hypothetical protein
LRGEVRSYGNGYILEVASDRSLEVLEDARSIPTDVAWSDNAFGSVKGVVETSYWTGPGSFEAVLRGNSSEGSTGPFRTVIACQRSEELPGAGDTVLAMGLMREGGRMLCYGDGSLTVLMRAVPLTAELISLVDTISRDPMEAPVGPFTVMGYIRSEPGPSSHMTIGESSDGGRLNVRVRLPEGTPVLHKGDLVELRNSTLYWDTDQARYGLGPEEVTIVAPYGPWKLDLGTAGDRIRFYLGSMVSIDGTLLSVDGETYLTDDGSVLQIRNLTGGMKDGATGTMVGTLEFDGVTTRLFIDAGKGVWTV